MSICPVCSRACKAGAVRRALVALAAVSLAMLAGCKDDGGWHAVDVSGSSPALKFTMTRARDGREVTAADYRGNIVMLYFGYTFCPDVCPTTLQNASLILEKLGARAKDVRFLFVTVDPHRDSEKALAEYVSNFGARFVGLRGTADQIAALARRYRVVYSVTPETRDHPYEVTHSSAVYVFDRSGAARLLVSSLGAAEPDLAGTEADLKRLAGG